MRLDHVNTLEGNFFLVSRRQGHLDAFEQDFFMVLCGKDHFNTCEGIFILSHREKGHLETSEQDYLMAL